MKTLDLARKIYTHYRTAVNPQVNHYFGIIANYGLVRLAELGGADDIALAQEILSTFPDKVAHPHYNFPSYAVCGIAKARAVRDGISPDEEQIRIYADELMTAPRGENGIISMPSRPDRIWIDVATAVTPFLLFAGLHFGETRYIDEAVHQTLAMYRIFLDPSCGLLHQSKNFCGEGKISEDHWSRGNGWGLLPLAELCANLPADHPRRQECIDAFRAHMLALLPYQSKNGMWRQEITVDSPKSYEETSGTGLILYAMGMGLELNLLGERFRTVFEAGIRGLCSISVREDGAIDNSCPGCLCPGDGSIDAYLHHKLPFRDEPHGAGSVILALVQAHRLGMKDIV
ncbi:MAG: glycoside hydrolase family 88 protein [Clostridia bacterium]|nr:glycoside hydrolase family 88 protein [Clostridia bacterium]